MAVPMSAKDDAYYLACKLVEMFPGLLDDSDVDCSDVVAELSYELGELDSLRNWLTVPKGN